MRSGGRFAGPEHDDFRADRRAVVEIDDVLVRQAENGWDRNPIASRSGAVTE